MKDPVSKTESGHNMGALVGLLVTIVRATFETREVMMLGMEEEARVEQRSIIRSCTPCSWRGEGLLDANDTS